MVSLLSVKPCFGQEGLGFSGQEVVQDQRTGLTLFPQQPYCIKGTFELSFDLAFFPNLEDYFGYIVRLIDNNNQNIDLVYNRDAVDKHFKIIIGERFSSIAFDIPKEQLFGQWTRLKLKFDVEHQQLWLYCGNLTFNEKVVLKDKSCYQVNFGLSNYEHFKSTDVPAMKLKDVRIKKGEQILFHWPLDEREGLMAYDHIKHAEAAVTNPLWIRKLHHEWQQVKTLQIPGNASVTFDPKSERVFVIGSDALSVFNIRSNTTQVHPYSNGKLNLADGCQSIYDTLHNRLLNFNVDQQITAVFDTVHYAWSANYLNPLTDHGHGNKFISPYDSSLYQLGGYGHFYYKNDMHRYSFPKQEWKPVKAVGQGLYAPRYLAALGATGRGAYIIGGYGSYSGKQVLNPRNFYDLFYFDVRSKTFKKIYDLKVTGDDFVFANSLVIDPNNKSYYGLIFPKHKFKSQLQLIMGSLEKPTYTLVGTPINYKFFDSKSYADLFYCPASKRFVAVTLFHNDNGMTDVQLYTLYCPPVVTTTQALEQRHPLRWGGGIVALFLLGGISYYLWQGDKRKKAEENSKLEDFPVMPKAETNPWVAEEVVVKDVPKEQIYLFGEFAIVNQEGDDISKYFTPLLKELFLVILLYSIRWGKGISSDKLIELLWFDKSEESARNNRSANIAKLKNMLDKYSDIKLLKEASNWRIVLDNIQVDYQAYLEVLKCPVEKEMILSLSCVIKRGVFLSTIEYQWLDPFKSEVSNDIVSAYLSYIQTLSVLPNAELLIRLTNELLLFDPINEEAVVLKCRALASLGQHSQAAHTFENFCKEYELLYGELYARDFRSIVSH